MSETDGNIVESAMSERLSMRKVREVLRLRYECGRSHAEIAASAGIGETTVGDYLARARRAELTRRAR